jgi:hypothetical protein
MRLLRCLAVCLMAIAPLSLTAQTSPRYTVRDDDAPTGSHIRRDLIDPINIAINQPYAELSAEDKATFRSNYERMADADEPPFPKKGLQALLKPIAQGQQKLLVRGSLYVVGVVDSSGKMKDLKVYGSPSSEMTQLAAQVMFLTEFKPAVCDGQPCAMEFPLRMRFDLR